MLSRWSSVLGENVIALIVGTFVLAVYMCLAAIDPATWTFQSDAALQIRRELWHCLSVKNQVARLDCYDEIAHQPPPNPARGANALPRAFGQEEPWR
jgi:hypothetical protein